MKKILLLFVPLFFVLMSCNKQSKARWYYYDETNCGDKWEHTINNEKLKENVTNYLSSRKITIYEMEIFLNSAPESCTSCTCKSGRRYKVKVKRSDEDEIKREGFFQ